jgi:hypothetical protein
MVKSPLTILILVLLAVLFFTTEVHAYSVLTHQALIDASWDGTLKPLLKTKYPAATEEQLREAHAHAYGGAIAPDMGYYPFGSKLFTNLLHYVRSGDFVQALLKEAKTLNEYAFALGSLCHYHADVYGHAIGINPSVALLYPKVRRKFGSPVTYAQDHLSHIRTEFGFDVLQSARGTYSSKQYRDFIGFQVDTAVLGRAFLSTYGFQLTNLFKNFPQALHTFRWSVTHFFPAITRTAWAAKKGDIKKLDPTATSRSFRYRMQRRNSHKGTGREDERPALGTTLVSLMIRIAPKVGPLRPLKFKVPGPEAEKLFIHSFDTVLLYYQGALKSLHSGPVSLANRDYDTGEKTARCTYPLADATYDALLLQLQQHRFYRMSDALKQHLLLFYRGPVTGAGIGETNRHCAKIASALAQLREVNRNTSDNSY